MAEQRGEIPFQGRNPQQLFGDEPAGDRVATHRLAGLLEDDVGEVVLGHHPGIPQPVHAAGHQGAQVLGPLGAFVVGPGGLAQLVGEAHRSGAPSAGAAVRPWASWSGSAVRAGTPSREQASWYIQVTSARICGRCVIGSRNGTRTGTTRSPTVASKYG